MSNSGAEVLRKFTALKYVSCPFDLSGYGNAARNYLYGLHKNNIPIVLKPITFERQDAEKSPVQNADLFKTMIDNPMDYDVVISHLTPEWYKEHIESGKVNLAYSVWETDKLFPDWVGWLNNMDGIMVASDWNKKVYENSGIIRPIEVVPHAIDSDLFNEPVDPDVDFVDFPVNKKVVFYTIGQFTARKNIQGTIKSFLHAFKDNDDVALVIKTFGPDYSHKHLEGTKNAIVKFCQEFRIPNFEKKIYIIVNPLSDNDIKWLHQNCDAYVSLHRAEGAGIPLMEAASCGKPIITTDYSGSTEFLDKSVCYPVNYTLTPVSDMPWIPWYQGDQKWAEPDLSDAIYKFREVYEDFDKAKKIGEAAKKMIEKDYNPDVIGTRMVYAINNLITK